MIGKLVGAGLIVAGPLLPTVCSEKPPWGRSVVVLFDLSESTNKPEIRRAYCDNFGTVLRSIGYGDALSGGWITERSAAELELPVDTVFPPFEPGSTNPILVRGRRAQADSALRAAREGIEQFICRKLEAPGRKVWETDIMSSLGLARKILAKHAVAQKVLVIMSDMIEDSDRYDFDTLTLGPEARRGIIDHEGNSGRLPNLNGVQVCVAGAYARKVERYEDIERFWRAYFESAGAELVAYAGPLLGCAG